MEAPGDAQVCTCKFHHGVRLRVIATCSEALYEGLKHVCHTVREQAEVRLQLVWKGITDCDAAGMDIPEVETCTSV